MRINITTRNFQPTCELAEEIEEQLVPLSGLKEQAGCLNLVIERWTAAEHSQYHVRTRLHLSAELELFADHTSNDLASSIRRVAEKLTNQLSHVSITLPRFRPIDPDPSRFRFAL